MLKAPSPLRISLPISRSLCNGKIGLKADQPPFTFSTPKALHKALNHASATSPISFRPVGVRNA
jgi:hypothetical protein